MFGKALPITHRYIVAALRFDLVLSLVIALHNALEDSYQAVNIFAAVGVAQADAHHAGLAVGQAPTHGLGDPEQVRKAQEAVARQGQAAGGNKP